MASIEPTKFAFLKSIINVGLCSSPSSSLLSTALCPLKVYSSAVLPLGETPFCLAIIILDTSVSRISRLCSLHTQVQFKIEVIYNGGLIKKVLKGMLSKLFQNLPDPSTVSLQRLHTSYNELFIGAKLRDKQILSKCKMYVVYILALILVCYDLCSFQWEMLPLCKSFLYY